MTETKSQPIQTEISRPPSAETVQMQRKQIIDVYASTAKAYTESIQAVVDQKKPLSPQEQITARYTKEANEALKNGETMVMRAFKDTDGKGLTVSEGMPVEGLIQFLGNQIVQYESANTAQPLTPDQQKELTTMKEKKALLEKHSMPFYDNPSNKKVDTKEGQARIQHEAKQIDDSIPIDKKLEEAKKILEARRELVLPEEPKQEQPVNTDQKAGESEVKTAETGIKNPDSARKALEVIAGGLAIEQNEAGQLVLGGNFNESIGLLLQDKDPTMQALGADFKILILQREIVFLTERGDRQYANKIAEKQNEKIKLETFRARLTHNGKEIPSQAAKIGEFVVDVAQNEKQKASAQKDPLGFLLDTMSNMKNTTQIKEFATKIVTTFGGEMDKEDQEKNIGVLSEMMEHVTSRNQKKAKETWETRGKIAGVSIIAIFLMFAYFASKNEGLFGGMGGGGQQAA